MSSMGEAFEKVYDAIVSQADFLFKELQDARYEHFGLSDEEQRRLAMGYVIDYGQAFSDALYYAAKEKEYDGNPSNNIVYMVPNPQYSPIRREDRCPCPKDALSYCNHNGPKPYGDDEFYRQPAILCSALMCYAVGPLFEQSGFFVDYINDDNGSWYLCVTWNSGETAEYDLVEVPDNA